MLVLVRARSERGAVHHARGRPGLGLAQRARRVQVARVGRVAPLRLAVKRPLRALAVRGAEGAARLVRRHLRENGLLFECFPYVCPEPVLLVE